MNVIPKLIILAVCSLLAGLVIGQTIKTYVFPNTGTIEEVIATFYLDMEAWPNGTEIPWGPVAAGESYVFENFTVHNTGNVQVYTYILTPDIPAYLTFDWGGNETILQPDEYVAGALTLLVAEDAPNGENFSFNLLVKVLASE